MTFDNFYYLAFHHNPQFLHTNLNADYRNLSNPLSSLMSLTPYIYQGLGARPMGIKYRRAAQEGEKY